ncbi:MAG: aspartate carbamoyltransferase regulatory subunit [Clostridia bacterium]|nr:aspartate carbamoyltransferase regulatory subunit [Clostridia bacterium]MBQ1965486.1 aspartate carbamoyltransferase regulatory subunit [Clostridia bacterium]MBQ5742694.1 aspartate carbamoyltransferase regulatory subunit [Clostridia bacterium]
MHIDSIRNGLVIDHISAGKGMEIYDLLGLGALDCTVAIIKNSSSRKMGKKDLIKIDAEIDLDLNILGYVDPGITVNVIKDGVLIEKKTVDLPEILTGVLKCKNPRCITSTEQELKHVFKLTDPETRTYRCLYCETAAK